MDVIAAPTHIQDHYNDITLQLETVHGVVTHQILFLITTLWHVHYHSSIVLSSVDENAIAIALHAL